MDNSMTQSKWTIFKIRYSRNSKSCVWNAYETLTFFLGKLQQKLFLFYTLPTQGILHTEFGLVWATPFPIEKTIFKIRYLKNSQNSVWKPNLFLAKLEQHYFLLYTLASKGIHHAEFGSVWTSLRLNQNELYLNFVIREIQKVPYEMRMKH